MKNIGIQSKLSVSIALLVAAMTAAIALAAYGHFEREFKDVVAKQHYAMVSAAARQLDSQVEDSLEVLRIMAEGIPADRLTDIAEMQRLLAQERDARLHFNGGFLLVDAAGRIITESPRHSDRRGKNHLVREYVRKTIETGKQVISEPYIAGVPPFEPTITYTAPIFDRSGKLKGLLAGRHLLLRDNYLANLARISIGKTGYLYLVSLDREIIMHPDKKWVLEKVPAGENSGIDRAVSGFEGAMENVNTKGVKGITSFNRLKNAPWIVASHYPLAEAYAPLAKTRNFLLFASVIIFIVSLISVWLLTRKITLPLMQLTEHVRSLPGGKEERSIAIRTGDELQSLAEAFNWMVAQIDFQDAERKVILQNFDEQAKFATCLLENTTTPLFVLDASHTVIVWNRACYELTGVPSGDMLGTKNHWRPFYPEQRPCLADLVLNGTDPLDESLYHSVERLQETGAMRAEGWYYGLNGKDRYLMFDAAPVYDSGGEIVAAVETLHDITQLKVTERKLQKQQAELTIKHEQQTSLFSQVQQGKREWEQTMDCIDDMVIMVDESGRILRCNQVVSRFTGHEYKKLLGMTWWELIFSKDTDIGRLNGETGELFHRPSGRWFYLNTYSMGEDRGGKSVITLHDLTDIRKVSNELAKAYEELKSTHMQLLQQEKMASIGQLAAGVAHEINNPMGFISSNLGTLGKYSERIRSFIEIQDEALRTAANPDILSTVAESRKKLKLEYLMEDIPKLIAESTDGAERVKTIVKNLKSFSRVDEAESVLVDLNECLESTLTIAWNELKYKCTVEKEYGDLPRVQCFPQQLNQVFLNLMVNSAHAIEKQGVITVRTWQEGEMVCVAIGDNGSGIPENIKNRIFEPFFTTKEVGKGTGLGLSISYDIIQRHHGTISVESTVGVGTTFTIKLPVNGGNG